LGIFSSCPLLFSRAASGLPLESIENSVPRSACGVGVGIGVGVGVGVGGGTLN
jgi:hypothetical protein